MAGQATGDTSLVLVLFVNLNDCWFNFFAVSMFMPVMAVGTVDMSLFNNLF